MARYSGPAGAKFTWADMPGLNADRADLDLLDVTIGTFGDASAAVDKSRLGSQALLGAHLVQHPDVERARQLRPRRPRRSRWARHGRDHTCP